MPRKILDQTGAKSNLYGDGRDYLYAIGDRNRPDAEGAHGHGQGVGPLEQHYPQGVGLTGQKSRGVEDKACRTLLEFV